MMHKSNVTYLTVEYYLAVKMNEILTRATTWMNLENTMLKEASHKTPHIVSFHLYVMFRIGKSIQRDKSLYRSWGREDEGVIVHGYGVSVLEQ